MLCLALPFLIALCWSKKTPPLLAEMFETVAVRVSLPCALYRITEYYSTPTMTGGKHNISGRRTAQARNNAWIMTGRANVAEPVSGRRRCPHFSKWMRRRGSHYTQDSGVAFSKEPKKKGVKLRSVCAVKTAWICRAWMKDAVSVYKIHTSSLRPFFFLGKRKRGKKESNREYQIGKANVGQLANCVQLGVWLWS